MLMTFVTDIKWKKYCDIKISEERFEEIYSSLPEELYLPEFIDINNKEEIFGFLYEITEFLCEEYSLKQIKLFDDYENLANIYVKNKLSEMLFNEISLETYKECSKDNILKKIKEKLYQLIKIEEDNNNKYNCNTLCKTAISNVLNIKIPEDNV